METQNASNLKNQLRKSLTEQRPKLHQDASNGQNLSQQLIDLVAQLGAFSVAAHLPFGSEPDIDAFIKHCQGKGIDLIMPRSNEDGSLSWFLWWGDTVPGLFGFNEPVGETASVTDAEVVIIPALAADAKGNRLGKGKGFYDKALAGIQDSGIPVVAVIYDEELLEQVPTEAHDAKVDYVVTPTKTLRIS